MDASQDYNSLVTYGGWTFLVAVGVALYLRSQQNDPRRKQTPGRPAAQVQQDLGRDVASATAAMKKKAEKALKPKPKPKSTPTENAAATSSTFDPAAEAAAKRDEARANQDFAQSFSKLKTGHQFTSTKKETSKQKSVKQSRAQEVDTPAANHSAPSSTTGDADDDLSPVASPEIAAADEAGVSDMLEKASPGPSVLRLTGTDAVKAKAKKEKAPEVVETKKQRQNRQKAERKKLEREQDELERKKLEESQRRRARIAEGRPAKDGSTFVANNENAWTAKNSNGSTPNPVQPLDTFEQKPETPAALSTPKPATNGTKERSDSWMSTLPSEEEQIAQVLEDSSAWNEVTTKKGKKGKKSSEPASEPVTKATSAPKTTPSFNVAPVAQAPVNGTKAKPALSSNSSFAALTPEETADDDDDVEEEWEV